MIGVFNTEQAALDFADKVHNHLLTNRKDYNAERWCIPEKSEAEEKWSVKIPPDFDKLKVVLDVENIEKIDKFPSDWRKVEAINIKK